jgi:transcriptional regulator with XRE-family HTH domain
MLTVDRPTRRSSLPMTDDPVNALSMPARTPTETPRLLKEWRYSFTPALSQRKAADELGMQLRTYTRWERGENYPQLANVEQIAPIMGLAVEEFYPVGDETPSETRARIKEMQDAISRIEILLSRALGEAAAAEGLQAAQPKTPARNGRTKKGQSSRQ